MIFSRFHIALLALVSIFTGMISPIARVNGSYLPLPFTNFRYIALVLVIFLLIAFFSSLFSRWRIYRTTAVLITGIIIFLSVAIPIGLIGSIYGEGEVMSYSWGWIFFIGGILFFLIGEHVGQSSMPNRVGLMGLSGGIFFLIFTSIIVYVSLAYEHIAHRDSILVNQFSSGAREIAGLWLSPAFSELENVTFERTSGELAFSLISLTGTTVVFGQGSGESLALNERHIGEISYYGGKPFILESSLDDGYILFLGTTRLLSGPIILPIHDISGRVLSWMSYAGDGWIWKNVKGNTRFIQHSGTDEPLVVTSAGVITAIASRSGALWEVTRNGVEVASGFTRIISLSLAENTHDLLILGQRDGKMVITRDGETNIALPQSFEEASFLSNGSDFLYQTRKNNYKEIHWNGETLSGLYDEIGPSFIFPKSSQYAFFARPLDHGKDWCLFVRDLTPLCGFEGYMNPTIASDGKSLIFAGYRNGIWSVYQNNDVLVRSTNYVTRDNSHDFFFVDPLKPTNFVFFIYDPLTDTYMINHNGTLLPQSWRGVGDHVWFGYNNRVITSVKYDENWHIIEIYAPPFR